MSDISEMWGRDGSRVRLYTISEQSTETQLLQGKESHHIWLWCHKSSVQFSSVTESCPTLRPHESQHARLPCPSPSPGVQSNSHPLSQWCHPAISSSVVPFSSHPQSLPASEPFPMSQLFVWRGQSIGVSALASFLPKNTQGWSPLEWTGWISLQSKGLSRVCFNTTVEKHQFFGTQLSSHPWSQWCHPAISSSVVPFSSCPQSIPASESFALSQFFAWGGQVLEFQF